MDAMGVIDKLPALHSRQAISSSLLLLFAAVFFLPYLFPVTPSVSLSFVVGYNNHVALLLFAFGSILFGILVRSKFPAAEPADQPLGIFSLVLSSIITLLFCIAHLYPLAQHEAGREGAYAINRVQMLASGLRPYIDFEYAYGPASLYLPVLFAHITHSSIVRGYYLWWLAQWLIGTVMLWMAIRLLNLPLPHRRALFWLLFLLELPTALSDGAVYTPIRAFGAAFFVIVVARCQGRFQRPIITALAALLFVFLAFAITPEQGVAVFVGLLGWFLILASRKSSEFPAHAAVFFACGGAIIAAVCWRLGEFKTFLEFSTGAFAFPILPSPANFIILTSYVAAACIAVHYLHGRRADSVVIPLFLVGYGLLPAALGRCDPGHLMIASPILLLGIATIEARSSLRKLWSPLAVCLVFAPLTAGALLFMLVANEHRPLSPQEQFLLKLDPAVFSTAPAPCPVIYRTLTVVPKENQTNAQDCIDTGYYFLNVDAYTPKSVELMFSDINRSPLHPLLLIDQPLASQFGPAEADPDVLYQLELSLWVPRRRNHPLTYDRIIQSIEENYAPDSTSIGEFRIWRPKPAPPSIAPARTTAVTHPQRQLP